jgi:uncharacterized protein
VSAYGRALERDASLAAVALGRALRAAGLPVTPDRSVTFAATTALLNPRDRRSLYWGARLSFVTARDQIAVFDAVFAQVVDGVHDPADARRGDRAPPRPPGAPRRRPPARRSAPATGAASAGDRHAAETHAEPGEPRTLPVGVSASDLERLTHVRLDELDDVELHLVGDLLRRLAFATPARRTRRAHAAHHGEHLDLRATLRRARRTGGDPVERLRRQRRERPRRLVVLLDVSGSMAAYARAYLLLLQGAGRGARAETFVFATRLTRVTRALREGRARSAV